MLEKRIAFLLMAKLPMFMVRGEILQEVTRETKAGDKVCPYRNLSVSGIST
jgi:hypothetical protein